MLTLYTLAPAFGQASGSAFSIKAMYLLNMSGLPWKRENVADPRKYPKSKLPALQTDSGLIGDSDNIRTYLEARGTDFDKGLNDEDKATSRAFIRMAEEHLYFHGMADRWANDEVWPHVRDLYFSMIPGLLRPLITRSIRRDVLRGLHGQGLGRFNEAERLARAEHDLRAIATRVTTRDYLFGDQPTAADASVAPMLACLTAEPVPTLLSTRIGEDAVLMAYITRAQAAMGSREMQENSL